MPFEKNIDDFKRYGTYSYSFDKHGNIILNASSSVFSQIYLSIPTNLLGYDSDKIEKFYNVNFEEFVPTNSDESVGDQGNSIIDNSRVSELEQENLQLKDQLKNIISNAEQDGRFAESESVKQVIIDLRISLGEGNNKDDFEPEFPYPAKENVEVEPQ